MSRPNATDECQIVLVVEDEPLILMNTIDMLSDANFEVLGAVSAESALQILEHQNHRVGVLFTDINMSGQLDGLQLARLVERRWPHIKSFVTSGRVAQISDQVLESRFIPKPYREVTLVTTFRKALQDRA